MEVGQETVICSGTVTKTGWEKPIVSSKRLSERREALKPTPDKERVNLKPLLTPVIELEKREIKERNKIGEKEEGASTNKEGWSERS